MSNPPSGIEQQLLHAYQNHEFVLYYQPQYHLANSQFCGLEALIRWQHPEKGLLAPAEFLAATEESGLIVTIGEWVLRTACEQNKAWQDKQLTPMKVAVNVASQQLEQPHFVECVKKVLKDTALAPAYLEIELTENIILKDEDRVINIIHQLKELGVSIALDDFGTGYSSISYLKKIPVDRIKIDRSYIKNINTSREDAAIVKAIVELADGLKLSVIAEGVESLTQLQKLMQYQCNEVQGYYFSHPLPADQVEKFLIPNKRSGFISNLISD